jgi:hypothetical protein
VTQYHGSAGPDEVAGKDSCSMPSAQQVNDAPDAEETRPHPTKPRIPTPAAVSWFLLLLAIMVHVSGRIAAFCGPHPVDSYVYGVAAYRLWQPGATIHDLIPDKPPGQAVLTGWVFRLWPGPPSRIPLIAVESLFMLAGYGVFALLCLRLFDRPIAMLALLLFVVADNSYNALDATTDGFNLNENYLMLPALLAVFAHLTVARPGRRGLLRGAGLGAALAIKQTVVALAAVMVVHWAAETIRRGRYREAAADAPATLAGVAVIWGPLLLFLAWRGWLSEHLRILWELSGRHVGSTAGGLWPGEVLIPMWPVLLCGALGILASRSRWKDKRASADGTGVAADREPTANDRVYPRASILLFLALWLSAAVAIIRSLNIPALHYWQQIAAPAALIAGFGIQAFANAVRPLQEADRRLLWRWVGTTMAIACIVAGAPLLGATSVRVHTYSAGAEAKEFARWLTTWSPGSAADNLRGR